MKLAFSTNAFKQVSLEESLRQIAACGYSGVEIMADVPHAYPPHVDVRRRKAVADLCRELRLTITNLNAFTLFAQGDTWHPSWIEPEAAARERRYEHTLNAIRLARDLRAPGISLEPGGPLPAGMDRAAAMELYREGLRRVLPAAQECGVNLLVEPEPHLLIERPEEFEELLAGLSHPRLGLNFDIGHFFCVGVDPAAAARRLATHIRHVHLEDIAPSREHRHLVPGRGAIDFDAVLGALADAGYNGWVTVELYPYEAQAREVAEEAFQYLSKWF
ncbi:MAG: sugar phosphate isomerase/epimerase [Planctomycetota bacterium]|nr:sugar phosphate isomerase/epimerase [Planctomycetota bacterium]